MQNGRTKKKTNFITNFSICVHEQYFKHFAGLKTNPNNANEFSVIFYDKGQFLG